MRINTETKVGLFVISALGIFFYMTFHLGVFRLDTIRYQSHIVYFKDVSGLAKKADVKIAGVKVGWVEDINLVEGNANYQARAEIKVHKSYVLRSDAHASVRQDGLLGNKYLEVSPGDSLLPPLGGGASLASPGRSPASVDDLLQQFKNIASNVEDVTDAIRKSIADQDGRLMLQETFKNIHRATEKIASFSEVADRLATRNENDINGIVSDIRAFASDLREAMPTFKDDMHRLAERLDTKTLPIFEQNVEKIGNTFGKDFGGIANKLDSTADAIEEFALQGRDTLRSAGAVVDKINDGKGLIGKLVNEDQTYHDLKVAVQGLKNYFSKIESLGVVFDSHFETMYKPAENFELRDSKGYLDIRVHPNEDHFYILQMMGSNKGIVKRKVIDKKWYDAQNSELIPAQLALSDDKKLKYAPHIEKTVRIRDGVQYGFQFGKSFKDIAFRAGLIEGSFGAGIDYDIPFGAENLRWVTSFEMFDMRGRNRIDDQRPHLKWINRVFFLRNFYFDFGADDFISKQNANTFFGGGIRFADDDIKYFISKLGFGSGMGQ